MFKQLRNVLRLTTPPLLENLNPNLVILSSHMIIHWRQRTLSSFQQTVLKVIKRNLISKLYSEDICRNTIKLDQMINYK